MNKPEIIRIDHVSKEFVIHKDKSLKERLVNATRSKMHTERYQALNDVTYSIKAGESVGLIGPNGSGKSTLLKTIGGILTPDSGSVYIRGRIAALLELGAGFHPDLTGRENIYLNGAILGLYESEINHNFDAIVEFSGIENFIDTQVKFYSSGMYVRLAFAVAVHSDPDILLVDEVLAVGDEAFQEKCMDKIREFQKQGRSIILVSHSAQQIVDVCDKAIVLNHGNLEFSGSSREATNYLHHYYQQQFAAIRNDVIESNAAHIISINPVFKSLSSEPDIFTSGSEVLFEVKLSSIKPLSNCNLIIACETATGRHVFSIDTRDDKTIAGIDLSDTETLVKIRIPYLNLGLGDYRINAALLDSRGYELDNLRNSDLFKVRGDSLTQGLINIQSDISLI